MDMRVSAHKLAGRVEAVTSKSEAHRALICAALANGPTEVSVKQFSADIEATVGCLEAMGAGIARIAGGVRVTPGAFRPGALLDCAESGSTLRFLMPVAAALGGARFTGRGRLPERPLQELSAALMSHNVRLTAPRLPFAVSGGLTPGEFVLPGNVSSQYVSGLLFALPLLQEDSAIRLTTPLESAAYAHMTAAVQKRFNVTSERTGEGFYIKGAQRYVSPGLVRPGGDWSNAAAFLAMGALAGEVGVYGLEDSSLQSDRAVMELLGLMGADVRFMGGEASSSRSKLHGSVIDVSQTPDLLPVLAAASAAAAGKTRFINAARLRLKESDRIASVAGMLRALGSDAQEQPDGLIVRPGRLAGGVVDSFGDHRIVMAAAVASAAGDCEVVIKGAEAVAKSYPAFFEDFRSIGGRADVV